MQFDGNRFFKRILASRKELVASSPATPCRKAAEEGGCGVVGFAATVPVRGRHIFEPSIQMHNRGNGKGGGIAAACMIPEQLGVDEATLRDDYILQVALLDPDSIGAIEKGCIEPYLRVDHKAEVVPAAGYEELGLETRPPDIVRYFVRARPDALEAFAEKHGLGGGPERAVEDEFVYRNSVKLNDRFYASLGDKRAFVLSHARNLMIFKIVGYAEQVVQYYGLEDMQAKIWIAHQRYPTKGRVWHPAGAHPFIGLNDALVHNGDFANYYSVSEYLRQHNIAPQFLTDTEVSALLFDLWSRTYGYPPEVVIEALAPTTELDFDQLPDEKKRAYRAIQALHMHGSPDGPWFFIIARSEAENDCFRLLGITDTSMLRPQVFAIQEGDVSIGLVASEKQAIDATLHSLAEEDGRFRLVADRYWNARGGSHTDGGAFIFTVQGTNGSSTLTCTDKFGKVIKSPPGDWRIDRAAPAAEPDDAQAFAGKIRSASGAEEVFQALSGSMAAWNISHVRWLAEELREVARRGEQGLSFALDLLTLLIDRRYDCGAMRASAVEQMLCQEINGLLDAVPAIAEDTSGRLKRIDRNTQEALRPPASGETTLVIHAVGFPPEGDECDARLMVKAYEAGWRRFIVYGLKGQRFHGCGLGPETEGVRLDLYGSSGDYVASGIDGMEIRIHGNGQDQLGQIMKRGRLVIFGDVGQTFLYGAKGGEVYVMGNAAGRPLINAVGKPRVVINGTCLDFLAESFMAGNPLNGGGFAVLNGMTFNDQGEIVEQASPYPGSNLFSLASGGAIYVRDPHRKVSPDQLNKGKIVELTRADWTLILPYLRENERLFGISIEHDLLRVGSERWPPERVYRKVQPSGEEIETGLEE
jgi:glutamate synthase domain-containing protein 1/glutamate synthase domain-containing protein 3